MSLPRSGLRCVNGDKHVLAVVRVRSIDYDMVDEARLTRVHATIHRSGINGTEIAENATPGLPRT